MRWRVALSCLVLAGLAQPAASQQLNQFVGFGDSTIDTGWYRTDNPTPSSVQLAAIQAALLKGAGGKFTEGMAFMSPEYLAAYFGITGADPANDGGSNYATGGARSVLTNLDNGGLFTGAVSLTAQIDNYLASGAANPNALYLISVGANDVAYALNQGRSDVQFPVFLLGSQDAKDYLANQANDAAAGIATLQAAGARFIIVPNLPESQGNDQNAKDYRKLYNDALWGGLAAAGVNFIPADIDAVRQAITKDFNSGAKTFGFDFISTNTTACSVPVAPPFSNAFAPYSLLCSTTDATAPSTTLPNDPSKYLFADGGGHMTSAGHKILADYYYSLVVAPSQISFLPETAVMTRMRLISNIQTQIDATGQQAPGANGFNFWTTGDVSYLKMQNAPGFPDDPSTPQALVGGLSYRTGGLILGGAFSVGHLKSDFSGNRGHFAQDEVALSAYAALRSYAWWGTLIGSYGSLDYDVNRLVPLGITVQSNTGKTDGTNISLAAQTGYDFKSGVLAHGPVAGLTLQRAIVHGFTESGTMDSVTSLTFESQTRDSIIGALGWKAVLDFGKIRPFAQLTWNHEFANTNRNITASLVTSLDAPSYFMPSVALGKDWGTATVGAHVLLAPGVTATSAFSMDAGQNDVVTYGGQVGINVAF